MTWHGLAEAFAPPPLSEQTYSAVQRVLDMRQIPDADVTGLSAQPSGEWVTVRCQRWESGKYGPIQCRAYLGEVLIHGSGSVALRCQRTRCKGHRVIVFVGAVPNEAELPILDYSSAMA